MDLLVNVVEAATRARVDRRQRNVVPRIVASTREGLRTAVARSQPQDPAQARRALHLLQDERHPAGACRRCASNFQLLETVLFVRSVTTCFTSS